MTVGQVQGNPFATRWVRPGAIPYEFPHGWDAERLAAAFRDALWRGAILGPHGSGKSTLLETLLPQLERLGRRPQRFALHDGQRRLPAELSAAFPCDPTTVIVVDGYEQLSRFSRGRLDRLRRASGCGLLVTTHGRTPLAELYRTETNLELARRIVARLVNDCSNRITEDDIASAFATHSGNLRETLFALYDLFEQRQRASNGTLT